MSSDMPANLKTYLGRVIRDIERHFVGNEDLRAFVRPLYLARRVLEQERRQRSRKVYSLHAPEVECIGKGKAHRPYEFGVKVSVATTVKHSAGGQFVTQGEEQHWNCEWWQGLARTASKAGPFKTG
jgi:IS5 family transposase